MRMGTSKRERKNLTWKSSTRRRRPTTIRHLLRSPPPKTMRRARRGRDDEWLVVEERTGSEVGTSSGNKLSRLGAGWKKGCSRADCSLSSKARNVRMSQSYRYKSTASSEQIPQDQENTQSHDRAHDHSVPSLATVDHPDHRIESRDLSCCERSSVQVGG